MNTLQVPVAPKLQAPRDARPAKIVTIPRASMRPGRDVVTPGGVFLLNPRALR
jgi:hypothetical protein